MAKILVTEEQFQKLMKRITEEAAGYDDFNVMHQHGGASMGILIDNIKDLTGVFGGIVKMTKSNNIEYIDLKENLQLAIDLIYEIIDVMKITFKDFTERKTIMKGEILHRKLESYQEKIVVPLLPENVLITFTYVFVTPEVNKSGPDVNALKGTPNDVAPDSTVIVSTCCFTCLLSEKSNLVVNGIFL